MKNKLKKALERLKAAAEHRPAPFIGKLCPDGTVYAGVSPDDKKPLYAMPEDADTLALNFNEAADFIRRANEERLHGHEDWRLPTLNELKLVYDNRRQGALAGTFNISGDFGGRIRTTSYYWSATLLSTRDDQVWGVAFSEGNDDPRTGMTADGASLSLRYREEACKCFLRAVRTGAP